MTHELEESAGNPRPAPVVPRHLSRRTIGLGAVWSVPVILTAVAAPAAAASVAVPPETPQVGTPTHTANKVAAAKRVDFTLTFSNTGTGAGTVELLSLTSSGGGSSQGVPQTVIVAPANSTVVSFSWNYTGNTGTADYTITYRASGTTGVVTIRI
jgi:hypothetical protein